MTAQPMTAQPTNGMRVFFTVWIGQVVSLIASGLTDFSLGIWVFQKTGSVTLFAMISLFAILPQIVLSPLAGSLADRFDRRKIMIVSNIVAGITTLIVSLLLSSDRLEVWMIYIAVTIISSTITFIRPSYASTTITLVPKHQLGRANGMLQIGLSAPQVIAPILAALLVSRIGINTVVLIDFLSYIFALGTLLIVSFPVLAKRTTGKRSVWSDMSYGLKYLRERPGLMALLGFMAYLNIILALLSLLVTPLVLSFTTTLSLGTVMSSAGAGMLAGSILLSIWGGPKRRINGVLGFIGLGGVFIIATGLWASVPFISTAMFCAFFVLPIAIGCINIILQIKVAPEVQGRVFGTIMMVAMSSIPIAYLSAAPLSEYVFEPLMAQNGALAGSLGQLIGVGPGRGIGLLFMVLGVLAIVGVVAAYLYPRLRLVEDELPDGVVTLAPTAEADPVAAPIADAST